MESSRVFVKNLPPTITEPEFRKHFSAGGWEITDFKLIAKRRIGYVGYKSHQDAKKAVKYFHRTYIRMTRISVELARPISDPALPDAKKVRPESSGISSAKQEVSTDSPKEEGAARKRKRDNVDESDPKLREFLEVMGPGRAQKRTRDDGNAPSDDPVVAAVPLIEGGESDDEYEDIPKMAPRPAGQTGSADGGGNEPQLNTPDTPPPTPPVNAAATAATPADDDEWLRSRTNRLLDLVDPDDPSVAAPRAPAVPPAHHIPEDSSEPNQQRATEDQIPAQDAPDPESAPTEEGGDSAIDTVEKTGRLFVRNLPYAATEDDLRAHFDTFGPLEDVHLAVDSSGKSKGFAFVHYSDSSAALAAFQQADRTVFQGRIIHVLPGEAKKELKLDEFALSQLPLKKQNMIRKRREAASSRTSWNALHTNQDAVNASVADRLGVSKSELLDPTSSDAMVKQALAETATIQETKAYFAANGVDLEAFKGQQRGDTAILVKNLPFGTTADELRTLFEESGPVLRVLVPPSGTTAIVEFKQPAHAKAAYGRLAYRRLNDSILFLEKAPKDIFKDPAETTAAAGAAAGAGAVQKLSATELLEGSEDQDQPETSSLFVRNLSFKTTTARLAETFKPLDGFVSALVKTKADPKKPGQTLSMGFGFVEFRTKSQAQAAQEAMDGRALDGHALGIKASHRGIDAAEERRREERARKAAGQRTKIVVKNLPFEATKKDVRALFGSYGQLRSVRVPKKFNSASRGFAFAEFTTAREAESALNALRNTHLLGRRLALDFAEAEAVDPEEEIAKMQKKIGGQVNKVALQQLTGRGRQRVTIGEDQEDEA